jgi:hypothetical protein
MKDKQDIRFEQLPNSEAVSGGALSTGAGSSFVNTLDDTASTNALKDAKTGIKGSRKKMLDPEALKLREQKAKETRRQLENDNFINAESTLMAFLSKSKPKEIEDSSFKPSQ